MNPAQVNARVVIPVTTYSTIMKGYPPDLILYANNYDPVDADHAIIERFNSVEKAKAVFCSGIVMSKGTTTSSGLVQTYYANVFGPQQYQALHEPIAAKYFESFFKQGILVGQLRTRLGLPGHERSGPQAAAKALLETLKGLSEA